MSTSWTLFDGHLSQGRTFQRPLCPTEHRLFLDGCFDGAADDIHHAELRLLNASQDLHLFSDENVTKAWLSTKRRFPLAGATIEKLPADDGGGDDVYHFFIREHDLSALRPNEIVFGQVASVEEIPRRMNAILSGLRPLSSELLVQLYVFRETDPEKADTLHLMTLIAHCVSDGTAKRTFMRCLVDTLARGADPDLQPPQIPLEDRLVMLTPLVDLEPMRLRSLSPARRRWRRAVGAVICGLREEKFQGGHTLPCHFTRSTPHTPAQPGFASILLTQAQTTTVLANCRRNGLTFGTAFPVLAQVAMTRVLYRRYLGGDISEEEWEFRKRQPHRNVGPFNLRPYLDKQWFENGGAGEFIPVVSLYSFELPFMTLGGREPHGYRERELSDGAPPFVDLLTFDRFLHRTGLIKKQANAFFGHPLFHEIVQAIARAWIRCALPTLMASEAVNDAHEKLDQEALPVTDMPAFITHAGSSFGNADTILPTEYPLPPTHPLSPFSSAPHKARAGYVTLPPSMTMDIDTTPRVVLENAVAQLHPRPMHLYLSAVTLRGQMNMYVCFDGNMYEEGVVGEWLEEVKGAVMWYLGQTHQSCHDEECGSQV